MYSITLFSPAKINLFLKVIDKRIDGFHNLASLFQTISLGDFLHFSRNDQEDRDFLTCTNSSIPIDQSNLILKAANLFRKKTGIKLYIKVHLEKHIPNEAGLGGGSSNAATTLWALNLLSNSTISQDLLAIWSAEIGSDIPFFFSLGTAFVTGRGEFFQNLPSLDLKSFSVIKPKFGLSTSAVFKNLKLDCLNNTDANFEQLAVEIAKGYYKFFNDLEISAFELKPELKKIKENLQNLGFNNVTMSGSGTSFFCFGDPTIHISDDYFRVEVSTKRRTSTSEWYK